MVGALLHHHVAGNHGHGEPVIELHVALAGDNGETLPGTDQIVTFNQAQGATIPARAPLLSDPIAMPVKPLTRLTISIHLPQGAPDATVHSYSAATGWTAPGDQTAATSLTDATTLGPRVIITGVEVENRKPARTIVTLGDSITDGVRATPDSDRRWPDLLAERLQRGGMTLTGVANAGISASTMTNGVWMLCALSGATSPRGRNRFT